MILNLVNNIRFSQTYIAYNYPNPTQLIFR